MRPTLQCRGFLDRAALALMALAGTPGAAFAQGLGETARPQEATGTVAAARTGAPPDIDGRADDAAWSEAPPISEFRLFTPSEGGAPSFRTEARVLYDDRALYVLVRAFDPHPDSVIRRLARRDTFDPTSDIVLLFLDPFHDRRTGYEFQLTAGGVKADALIYDDTGEDISWDGVWDAATGVDSAGWVAEFAIPLRQLRSPGGPDATFGVMIGRWVGRSGERASWPQYRRSRAGLASQFGTLTGLRDLPRSGSVELVPYGSVRSHSAGSAVAGLDRIETRPAVGGTLRWAPRPTVTIDATVNPDFGQVESDPAVLDLTGAEVFQSERRPFFVEAGALGVPLGTDGASQFFYSRRIGRRPALRDAFGEPNSPSETTVLGASRVTARLRPGTVLSLLTAVTGSEEGAPRPDGGGYLLEPRAHYGAVRLQHDLRRGRSGMGFMVTRVDRASGDSLAAAHLPGVGQAVVVTTQHQTADGYYRVSAWGAASEVRGRPEAIARLQLSPVHAFQRPDDGVALDPARTGLSGFAGFLSAGKVGGGALRYGASYRRLDPGFDVNEMGFLTESGVQLGSVNLGTQINESGSLAGVPYRRAELMLTGTGQWTTAGLAMARGFTLRGMLQLPNQVLFQAIAGAQLSGAYCTTVCTRGGPALVDPPEHSFTVDVTGDPRSGLVPHAMVMVSRDDGGRSHVLSGQADVAWRIRSNLDVSLAALVANGVQASQFYGRFGDPASDTAHYTVARLDRRTRSLTARVNYTVSPLLTLQWYGQAYISRGAFDDVRELAEPRSPDWSARFRPYPDPGVAANPGGVDFKQLRSNVVLRWEYRPGSAMFLVWGHGRDAAGIDPATPGIWPGRDLRDLFRLPASNTVILKVSYWIGR
jgi:hypothetical protein